MLPCLQRPHTSEDMWLPSSVVSLHRAQQQSKYQYFLHRAEVKIEELQDSAAPPEVLAPPAVAEGGRDVARGDLLASLDGNLGPHLRTPGNRLIYAHSYK